MPLSSAPGARRLRAADSRPEVRWDYLGGNANKAPMRLSEAWLSALACVALSSPALAGPDPQASPDPQPKPEAGTSLPSAEAEAKPAAAQGTAAQSKPEPGKSGDAAETQVAPKPPAPEENPEPEITPPAKDTRTGHFQLGGSIGGVWPVGSFDSATYQSDLLGFGLSTLLDVGYGVSRSVVVGAWGEFDTFDTTRACGQCSAHSFAFGPLIRYHLVQGLRMDPYATIAMGFRTTRIENPVLARKYSGIEWARVALGTDWYPIPNVGFGPYLDLALGVYGNRPDATIGKEIHASLGAGLRLVVDLPGK
jgi:hypothetical protein